VIIDNLGMENAQWNNLRAKLNHDWLQNRYLTFLMARGRYMDELMKAGKLPREDIQVQFIDWQRKENDFAFLINESIESLNPAQLVDEYPLNLMADENRLWLKEVVHVLYIERTGMTEKVAKLKEKLKLISDVHKLLSRILNGENNELNAKAGENPFTRFFQEVQEFGKMISCLPHEVQVV
jgi:hypothetical protein